MTVGFKNIPANIRVPLFYAEVDNSQANTGATTDRALIVGQMLSAGTATAGVPVLSMGVADAKSAFGQGSIAALMVAAYRAADNFGELWVLPLADDPDAVAAAGSIDFTAVPPASGTLSLYIAGQLLSLAVVPTQTTAEIATSLAAAVNAMGDLPVTAAIDETTVSQVDLTAKNKGLGGNDIDLRVNYQGAAGGEVTPAGLALTITAMSGGTTNPSLATPFADLGSQAYDYIALAYNDTTSLNAVQSLLDDQSGRWSWDIQVYGHCFAALRGTAAALVTAGNARNDQHCTVMGFYDSPSPNWIWAADLTATAAVSLRADPALPLQTLALSTALAPPLASRFQLTEQNTLLWDGIATFTVADDGTVAIQNLITTYQLDPFGDPDDSYLEVNTMYTLMAMLRALSSVVTSKYARVKLAADGTRFAAGSNIVTPSTIKADLIAEYAGLVTQGLAQNATAFAQGLIVEQNATNPNRVDVLWPGTLIDQLRIFAVLAQFRLI